MPYAVTSYLHYRQIHLTYKSLSICDSGVDSCLMYESGARVGLGRTSLVVAETQQAQGVWSILPPPWHHSMPVTSA